MYRYIFGPFGGFFEGADPFSGDQKVLEAFGKSPKRSATFSDFKEN
jgi:hypothetical protein